MKKDTKIIVIGTSAGGMQALAKLIAQLPANLPAAIFVVQHLSVDSSPAFLAERLSQESALACKVAEHKETIVPGTVYLAQADRHLLLREKEVLVVKGPRENLFRPAIDTLFRSAAAYHGARVIGIILTGFLSDGVLGMEYVKRCGGITVVQDPEDAEYPVLPRNVLQRVETDYVVGLEEMSSLLAKLAVQPASVSVTIPTDIWQEAKIVERVMTNSTMTKIDDLDKAGKRSVYSCPECGGGLWELAQPGTLKRFRCHSGHAYNTDSLLSGMDGSLEETLWVALRTLEERRNILLHLSQQETGNENKRWSALQEARAEEMKVHVQRLRELLSKSSPSHEGHVDEAS